MESDLTNDEKEKVLRKMNPAFRYILKHHIYLMRASAVTFNVSVPMVLMPPIAGPQALAEGPEGNILYRQVQPLPQAPVEKKMILAARTNLLVPALNVGVEVPVGYSWSVGADYWTIISRGGWPGATGIARRCWAGSWTRSTGSGRTGARRTS